MKIKKSIFALVLTVAIVASFAAGATASSTLKPISAYIDYGATVTLDGVKQDFLDANGKRIYVIAYDGATYLPIRPLASTLGLSVDWDQASRTVKLGQDLAGSNLIDEIGAYFLNDQNGKKATQVKTAGSKTYTISGYDCTSYVQLYMNKDNYYGGIGATCRASYNIKGEYQTVTFKYYSDSDATLRVITDNEFVQKEIEIPGGQVAQEVSVNLYGATQLSFEAVKTQNNYHTNVYIFDARVSK